MSDPLVTAGEWAAAISAGSGAAVGAYKLAIKPVYQWVRSKWHRLESTMELVHRELCNNCGGSVKDVVHRIDTRVAALEGRHWAMLTHSGVPTFETDSQGRCTLANRAFVRLVGKDLSELRGLGWLSCVALSTSVDADWREALDEGRSFAATFPMLTASGTIKVYAESVPIPGPTPESMPLGHIVSVRPVEESS